MTPPATLAPPTVGPGMPAAAPKGPLVKGKGRAGARTAADRKATEDFEKEHPRAAKGRTGGGAWIQKGQGTADEPDLRVRHLQNRLAALGYPVRGDGQFGDRTHAAVVAFQNDHGLAADGLVGPATTQALRAAKPTDARSTPAGHEGANREHAPVTRASEDNPAAADAPVTRPSGGGGEGYGAKYAGAAGAEARAKQNFDLAGDANLSKGGKQNASGQDINAKGEVIKKKGAKGSKGSRGSRSGSGGSRVATDGSILGLGVGMDTSRGDKRVREIQQMLSDAGYDLGAGGKDGRFGPDTRAAIRKFQKRYGLKADGIIGPKTRLAMNYVQKLDAAKEKKRPGSTLEEAAMTVQLTEATTGELAGITLAEAIMPLTATDWAFLEEAADSMRKASTPEPFSRSKTSNWVARGGGLPAYIQHIAHDLMEKRGFPESKAIQMAIGIVKRWARGGGKVDANTRAAAAKAVAEWEALKAKAKAARA